MLGAGVARHGPAGRHLAGAELPDRHRGRRGAGGARRAGSTRRSRSRRVTLFALPGYWLGLMLVMVFTYRLRLLPAFGAAGLRRRLPPAGRAPGRPAPAPRAAARHAHARRHRRHRAVRPRRHARRGRRAVRDRGARQGTVRDPGHPAPRAPERADPGASPCSASRSPTLFSGAVFIEAIFAWPGRGPGAGRGGAGARLPGRHGGDRGERGAGRAGQPAGRAAGDAGSDPRAR